MGKMVEQLARAQNFQIVSIIAPSLKTSISKESLADADVCIDFTHPESVLNTIRQATRLGKNIVVGTTGWQSRLESVKEWVEESQTGLFYASNFSLGVNLFFKTVEKAAELFLSDGNPYDVAGLEIHHNQKIDAPSGTALELQAAIACAADREPESIPFSSIRCGSVPGTHTVYFDGPADTITLTHQARSRNDFAQGALTAAKWMQGKKGVYTMEDLICRN